MPTPIAGAPNNGGYWNTSTQASGGATNGAYLSNMGTYTAAGPSLTFFAHETSPAIEDAGIRAGEIIAYRAWFLRDNLYRNGVRFNEVRLRSIFVGYWWEPNGDNHETHLNSYYGNGFHAFKRMEEVERTYGNVPDLIVFGEVALWGEVIEHERGYRAEHACIRSVLEIRGGQRPSFFNRVFGNHPNNKLNEIRRIYGLKK